MISIPIAILPLATAAYSLMVHCRDKTNNIINYDPVLKKKSAFLDKEIIYTSALLHDMCDKKYMSQKDGIKDISKFISSFVFSKKDNESFKLKNITFLSYSYNPLLKTEIIL